MSTSKISRRRLMTSGVGAGFAVGALASASSAQQAQLPPLPNPDTIGAVHGAALEEIGRILGDSRLDTEEGLNKIIAFLETAKIITSAEAEILRTLVRLLLVAPAPSVKDLIDTLRNLQRTVPPGINRLAQSIVAIAIDSAGFALRFADQHPRAMRFIAADVAGAIGVCVAAFKLPGVWGGLILLGGGIAGSAMDRYAPPRGSS